jgi:tetratricopeptide (TPR) repeat protein
MNGMTRPILAALCTSMIRFIRYGFFLMILGWPNLNQAQEEPLSLEMSSTLLTEADRYFEATLFDEAIGHYRKILEQSLPPEKKIQITLRMAQAHYALKQFSTVIDLLKDLPDHPLLRPQPHYLSGLAYQHLGQWEMAISSFKKYLHTAQPENDPDHIHAMLELGLALYQNGQSFQAQLTLNSPAFSLKNPPLYELAHLISAHISLDKGKIDEVEHHLSLISLLNAEDLRYPYEALYLKAEVAFYQRRFDRATQLFEQASQDPHLPTEEQADILYPLGWSYLKLAEFGPSSLSLSSFEKAEKLFHQLWQTTPSEKAALSLSQTYVAKFRHFQDPQASIAAEQWLNCPIYHSLDAQAHVLLLKGELSKSVDERHQLYQELTKQAYAETSFYPIGWYLKGLNEYGEGFYDKAILSLTQAFECLNGLSKPLAALAIKLVAQAYSHLNTEEGDFQAFHTLERILDTKELMVVYEHPDEIFYLYGIAAQRLAARADSSHYHEKARAGLEQGLKTYPNGPFIDKILYQLGCVLFYQQQYNPAELTFLKVAIHHPSSLHAGDAFFWASKSAEKQNRDPTTVREYRLKVYEEYPGSSFAPEAYFSLYSYRDYLQGDRQAIRHLQKFKERFPQTPSLILAHFLIGMDLKRDRKNDYGKRISTKNLNAAIESLHEAEMTFDRLFQSGSIPEDDLPYFIQIRYRAILERALANLAIAEESQGAKQQIFLQYAEEVFKEIIQHFHQPTHPLISHINQEEPSLLEESAYWLAQTYIKSHNDALAEKILKEMLDYYRQAKINRSYYLSRAWYDLGLIATRRQEYWIGLEHLNQAESTAKSISIDQKIDLWIQKSECYKALNELNKAMLILSQAINDDAISSLRIKAMFLRAEIYARQGRHELARKQLEATSKKGGEWAIKAKEKLEKDNGT